MNQSIKMKNYKLISHICLTFILVLNYGVQNVKAAELLQSALKAESYEGNVVTDEGAWCWFADPRALHYENAGGTINSTYIGYIDVHGNIKATQHDFITGKNNEVLIRSYFQPDDHDNPSFLVLPDERIMMFYSRHTDEACFYYRISKKPGDITSLGAEMKIITANNTTYPSPFILSDDPTHIYLCWRGINWHPTIAKLTIPDADDNLSVSWGPYQIVQSTGARPYAKYTSNGKDKLYMTYTSGHPDNENPNYIYYNYIDINSLQLKDITGNVLSTIANGVHNVNKTTYPAAYPNAMVDMPTNQRDWVWQTTLDKDGMPVVAMVQINNDKTVHNYYYAKWTGSTWRKTFLANGGGRFHQTAGLELCYSGGMALDDENPNVVYCSVPVAGTSGTVFEIIKYTISETGIVTNTEQITTNSTLNNVRPFVIPNSGNSPLRLTWMHGNYYDWIVSSTRPQGFPTGINCDFALPVDDINLDGGLVVNEDFNGAVNGTAQTKNGVLVVTSSTNAILAAQSAEAFSVSLTPYIYQGAYKGTIFTMNGLAYGLNGNTLKPFVTIGTETYNSTNLLGTSDVWQTTARGTGGIWYDPSKLKYFNLSLTYENGVLKIFRNGLIDQVIEVPGLSLSDINIGGFAGWVEDCRIYNRALTQAEVKKLTKTSLSYTFDSNLIKEIELEVLNIPKDVYTDIVFPAKTSTGNTISWVSDNTSIISNAGLVTFPQSVATVAISATANGLTKVFNVNVYPRNIENNKVIVYNFESEDTYTKENVLYVKDKSGRQNDAIIYGNAVVNGNLDLNANTAAGFSTNGFALVPAGILGELRSYSFLVKINAASLASQPRIFDFGSASSNSLLLRANAFTAGYKYNGGSTTLVNSSSQIPVGQDAKIAMTFDAKTKTTKIYLNGIQTASSTSIIYEPYQLAGIGLDKRNYIGRTQWWDTSEAANNIDFKGTVDDFRLYNLVLTPEEIIQLQNNTGTGLSSVNNISMAIYPNPIIPNSNLQLTFSDQDNEIVSVNVEVVNLVGQIIQQFSANRFPASFAGPSKSGVYFVLVTSGNNILFVKKLIVV
jgi:hypothetical protein